MDLLREWFQVREGDVEHRAEELADAEAVRDGGPRPTEADLAALAETHAELLRTPRAQREHPTELLVKQAAESRHISAVLDLLPLLPGELPGTSPSCPQTAFSALWIVTTGADIAPW